MRAHSAFRCFLPSIWMGVILGVSLVGGVASAGPDALESGFKNPPSSAKPHTWWHWMNGNITREGITADLEAMQQAGIGGAQIFNADCEIPAGPVKFLTPEWREMMKHAAREADRLGLELCLHNCAGWSSSGGPWNTPEHAMQRVTTSELKVKGPASFSQVLPQPPTKLNCYRDIAVLAFRTPEGENGSGSRLIIENVGAKSGSNGDFVSSSPAHGRVSAGQVVSLAGVIDLTSRLQAGGQLVWDVPAGDWTILRLGYTPTGKANHPAPPEGTGPECDKLSPAAFDAHWAGFVQKVLDDLGPLAGAGKALNNVLIDSYEVGGQNWTPEFRAEFKKRRGYDLLPYLPTLTARVVESPEVSERFLWDMRRTIADLFAENYYGRFKALCHQHGLQASVEPYTGPFDSVQCGEAADIPMGEFWVGSAPDSSVKLAASVGHVYGRQVIGAESFTAAPSAQHGRWLDDPYAMKALGDLVFCQGVNRYIFHRYALQPWTNRLPGMTMGQWGTHFDRTSTWWNQGQAWLRYVARCQFLLQQGLFVADAAYYCGESTPVQMRVGEPGLPPGYDYDALNASVLLHHAAVKNGTLVLDSGMGYRVLILPPSDRNMTPALLRRLSQFVNDGLTVVGAPPQASPSLEGFPACDEEVKQMVARMWADCDGRNVTEHKVGQGKVVWGQSLDKVFAGLDLKPDFSPPSGEGVQLACIHRRAGQADVYFVSNQRNRYEDAECSFRVTGKLPELWNAETGSIEPAPIWREEQGRTVVSLNFEPVGSVFVVFRAAAPADHLVKVDRDGPAVTAAPRKPVDLRILDAVYGVFPGAASGWMDVTEAVKALVAGGTSQIPAGNDLAGDDPVPMVVKLLRVEYRLNGQTRTNEAKEGQTLQLPAGAEVVKALYGVPPAPSPSGKPTVNLTAKLNGLIRAGELSVRADNHLAGGDPAVNTPKELRMEYSVDGVRKRVTIAENENLILPETGRPSGTPPAFQVALGDPRVLAWAPGRFTLTWASGRKSQAQCDAVPAPLEVPGSWDLSFPPGWGAPAKTTFTRLESWSENSDPGIKYFSGTGTYTKDVEIPAERIGSQRELWLDLGVVKNFAEVTLNGQSLGVLWKAPFRVKISSAAKAGLNRLEVKVTNLWPNRLIGDEQLPPDCEWRGKQLKAWPDWVRDGKPSPTGRLTFTTWHHWTKTDALLNSGLLGPVTLHSAVTVEAR